MTKEYKLSFTGSEIDEKLKIIIVATEEDYADLLAETDVIYPLVAANGAVYTNNNGDIYIL